MRNTKKLKRYKSTAFKAKDSHYDKEAADFAVAFIENLCHTKGTWAGKPFLLLDWQEQIIRDLFGILKPNGYRQFNTAYVEIPKKNGKSELAAAIALLLCCGDGEERAEVYGCAADRQQASIVFEVAADIARIFRVPPHMVGDLEKSSFSNIEQQSLEFVKYTLDPWVVRWEQSIQRTLLTAEEKKQYFVKFNLEGLLRGDYQSRMNGYATARQNGWMSANDIRELENLDRIPASDGGDLYLINGNMLPLEHAGAFASISQTGKEETNPDESPQEVLEVEKSGGRRTRGKGA